MVSLEADEILLERYKPLFDQDLKVTTTISNPNGSIHCMENLTWFWTMDIPRDAQESDWMSEFHCVNWLHAKAVQDRWKEEVELIKSEVRWMVNCFDSKCRQWEKLGAQSRERGAVGHAVYATRQAAIYANLRDQCPMKIVDVNNSD
ncbi:hypothetical protein PAXRUDRAFT_179802 [Paxillus rubicundulus Ve08.2h10]|uniref:Uncharacterized protein n=1 Tax=Paxillus rubicundulus Ve08.2h10 TaxID=930991 RepID=A0A0D0CBH8_9AGAM|nr:hypothetical protein PAXRUDRAFT_179802 [Paxillus rubicundulus Ve08.2h10]